MDNKEHNFVSAVVLASESSELSVRQGSSNNGNGLNKNDNIHNDNLDNLNFLKHIHSILDTHFLHFEIIVVNPTKNSLTEERAWAKTVEAPVTIVNMSLEQPPEQCMNAGLDIAIGDYVYEFDSTFMPYDEGIIWEAYLTAQKGNDIVSVSPNEENLLSHLFYKLFNAHSNSGYKLRTDAFRLISRRTINRVHAMNENLPYRKAAYAASGLKMAELIFNGRMYNKYTQGTSGASLALDSIILYTDYGFKLSIGITLSMMLLTIAELVYAIFAYTTGKPVSGWSSTVGIITVGFTGMFGVFTIMLKYLSMILKLIFKKQSYMVESVEKL